MRTMSAAGLSPDVDTGGSENPHATSSAVRTPVAVSLPEPTIHTSGRQKTPTATAEHQPLTRQLSPPLAELVETPPGQ